MPRKRLQAIADLDSDLMEAIDQYADRRTITRAAAMRELLKMGLRGTAGPVLVPAESRALAVEIREIARGLHSVSRAVLRPCAPDVRNAADGVSRSCRYALGWLLHAERELKDSGALGLNSLTHLQKAIRAAADAMSVHLTLVERSDEPAIVDLVAVQATLKSIHEATLMLSLRLLGQEVEPQ